MSDKYRIVITEYKDRLVTLLYENDRILNVFAEENVPYYVGDIFMGKVIRLDKGSSGAFIEISPGYYGYLNLRDNNLEGRLKPEDIIPVQINNDAIKTKKAGLTTEFLIDGKYLLLSPSKEVIGISSKIKNKAERQRLRDIFQDTELDGYGFVIRTMAKDASEDDIRKEAEELDKTWKELRQRIRIAPVYTRVYSGKREYEKLLLLYEDKELQIITDNKKIYEEISALKHSENIITKYYDDVVPLKNLLNLDTLFSRFTKKIVWLRSGGFIVIEPTEALVSIDVNSGKADISPKSKNKDMINEEAALEIMNQIRFRNLSGIIIVDFIDLVEPEEQERIVDIMKKEALRDSMRVDFQGFSQVNLLAITRQKRRAPLHEVFKEENEAAKI